MTGDLLQSDIDLARKLIAEGQPDAEVLLALGQRKVDPENARRLVVSLRNGVEVRAEPFKAHPPRSSSEGNAQERPQRRKTRSQERAPGEPIRDDYGSRYQHSGFPWFRVAFLVAVCVSVAVIFFISRRSQPAVARAVADAPRIPLANIRVEVQQGALTVSGNRITRANALTTLSELLGPPTRTNRISGSNKVIYAYDSSGLLYFSDDGGTNDCLMVYFEAVGGANGANLPFPGTLKIENEVVTLNTDSKALASMKGLGLSAQGTNTIFSGQSEGVGLSFAYLKTPSHLSLVQIDLK